MTTQNPLLAHMLDDSKDRVTEPFAYFAAGSAWLANGKVNKFASPLYTAEQLQSARAAAMAEAAKDRADAERYRFLSAKMMGADFDWNESGACALVFEWPKDVPVGADCDRNIDAAIAAGGAR